MDHTLLFANPVVTKKTVLGQKFPGPLPKKVLSENKPFSVASEIMETFETIFTPQNVWPISATFLRFAKKHGEIYELWLIEFVPIDSEMKKDIEKSEWEMFT